MDISHLATCPDVAPTLCMDEAVEIPPHVHDLTIAWRRAELNGAFGLGNGWQLGASVPFDVRDVSVVYSREDGGPYAPPYEDTHHRDERLAGPVDGSVVLRRYTRAGRWSIGAEAGVTVPLGATVENPWRLTALGETHQHQQLGTGTWNPTLGAELASVGGRLGALASLQARVPVAENDEGYRAARTLTVTAGPSWRVHPRALLTGSVEGGWTGPETWDGRDYGGRTLVAASAGLVANVSPHVSASVHGRLPVWQALHTHTTTASAEDGSFAERALVAAGLTWTGSLAARDDDPPR